MARLPFVDTHVHYWDLRDPSLRYEWLMPDWVHPGPRQHRRDQGAALHGAGLHRRDAIPERLKGDPRPGCDRHRRPGRRDAWLQAQADETGFPHGIVAHCDLAARTRRR